MKKLLFILLFVTFGLFGQTVEDFQTQFCTPEVTASFLFNSGTLNSFAGGEIMPYSNGAPVGPAIQIYSDGFAAVIAFGGDDYCHHVANNGDELQFVILHNSETIVIAHIDFQVYYYHNAVLVFSSEMISFHLLDGNPLVLGCADDDYVEYDYSANVDDGSCLTPVVLGCMAPIACNYDSSANTDDGSCDLADSTCEVCEGTSSVLYDTDGDGFCDLGSGLSPEEVLGCQDNTACNYDASATDPDVCDFADDVCEICENGTSVLKDEDGDGFCDLGSGLSPEEVLGCDAETAFNYEDFATEDDGSCYPVIPGCINPAACNFDSSANTDDDSCEYCTPDLLMDFSPEPYFMTLNKMSVLFQVSSSSNINSFNNLESGDIIFALSEGSRLENEYLGYSEVSEIQVSGNAVWLGEQLEIRIYGRDSLANNGFDEGEEIVWVVVRNNIAYHLQILDDNDNELIINWENDGLVTVDNISVGAPFFDGCMDPTSPSFNPLADSDNGSCSAPYSIGCMDENAINYAGVGANPNNINSTNFGDPFIDNLTINLITGQAYPSGTAANFSDDSFCQYEYGNEYLIDSLQTELDELNDQANLSISILQQALDTWNTTIDLQLGWNIIGYGCPESIDLVECLSNHTESIIITKDNNGNVYMPEFGFNGIGDFTPGFGYQIKVTEAIEGFTLCDWYVNDIPEDNIVSLQEEIAFLHAELDSVNTSGCTDSSACNFNESNLHEDGSCEYAEQGYDCDGFVIAEIGDIMEGGFLFYIDSTGRHGLVSAMYNLGNYRWAYNDDTYIGVTLTSIGTGYENTLNIVNQDCLTENECIIAAQAAITVEYASGYSGWFLPSRDELIEMYNTIGPGGPQGNIGNFIIGDGWAYWSSSEYEYGAEKAYAMNFDDGYTIDDGKDNLNHVRPIRSF